MRKRFALSLVLLLAVLGPLAARSDAAPARRITMQFEGRNVDVYVPAGRPQALVVLLHGYELTSADVAKSSQLVRPGTREGWLIVVPNGVDGSWNAGLCCGTAVRQNIDDVTYLADLVKSIRARRGLAADAPTVMGGFSDGAMMTEEFMCRRPGVIDGAFLISGNLQDASCDSAKARAILEVKGRSDHTVPAGGLLHSTFLDTHLLPDKATLTAAEHGLSCRTTEVQTRKPVGKGYTTLTAVCPHSTFTSLTEVGGHTWLRGTAGTPSETTPLILSMVYHLEPGRS